MKLCVYKNAYYNPILCLSNAVIAIVLSECKEFSMAVYNYRDGAWFFETIT